METRQDLLGAPDLYGLGAVFAALWTSPLVTLAVTGLENVPPEGGLVLAGNHPSAIDLWIMMRALPRPFFFIPKAEHLAFPFGDWYRRLGAAPIRPGDFGRADLETAEAIVRSGHVLGMFCEGGVTRGSRLMPFSPGFIRIASRAGVPVLPAAIAGTENILDDPIAPRGLWGWRLRRAQVKIRFLEPVRYDPDAMRGAALRDAAATFRETIGRVTNELRAELNALNEPYLAAAL